MTSSESAITEIAELLEELSALNPYSSIERSAYEIISKCRENRRDRDTFADFVIRIVSRLALEVLSFRVQSWNAHQTGIDWLNQQYPSQGVPGATAAMLDYGQGDTRALDQIEEALVAGFLNREHEKLKARALTRVIGLSWEKRVQLTAAAQQSYARVLPPNLRDTPPEQIAPDLEELLGVIAESGPILSPIE
jgi:hypothetical protein